MPGKEAYRRSMERAFAKGTRLKAKAMKREQKRGKLSNGGEASAMGQGLLMPLERILDTNLKGNGHG
jgi:hypothetical protein